MFPVTLPADVRGPPPPILPKTTRSNPTTGQNHLGVGQRLHTGITPLIPRPAVPYRLGGLKACQVILMCSCVGGPLTQRPPRPIKSEFPGRAPGIRDSSRTACDSGVHPRSRAWKASTVNRLPGKASEVCFQGSQPHLLVKKGYFISKAKEFTPLYPKR